MAYRSKPRPKTNNKSCPRKSTNTSLNSIADTILRMDTCCDLKLENVMIDSSEHIRIIDFGSAIKCLPGDFVSGLQGTVPYMAPEVAVGNVRYNSSCFFWSLV
ncbi:G protein-coupled receptor kinase 5 [Nowakowskiella sp. JEL0407]|nr:G protein-coupled receptor kinase 5 [Nowakowskiella sp. JEL0407]